MAGSLDSVGGQMRGDKELGLFSGVLTSCGRVWRKVPKSEEWIVV